ncbi:MAG TPA: methyltransferase domain-containing protein [Thermoleophilaceae bacterium]
MFDCPTVTSGPSHVHQTVSLASGPLRLLQPAEAAELPDDGAVEWAPLVPYWAVLWRSGVALAQELDGAELRGIRVVELGCGLGAPSIAAARAGASVLATDEDPEALELVARNARLNDVRVETARVDWWDPDGLVERGPFDLVLAADVLYTKANVDAALALFPRLVAPGGELRIADPNRAGAQRFLAAFEVVSEPGPDVSLHTIRFAARPAGHT